MEAFFVAQPMFFSRFLICFCNAFNFILGFSGNSEGGGGLGMFFHVEWWWNFGEIRSGGRFKAELGSWHPCNALGWEVAWIHWEGAVVGRILIVSNPSPNLVPLFRYLILKRVYSVFPWRTSKGSVYIALVYMVVKSDSRQCSFQLRKKESFYSSAFGLYCMQVLCY